METPFHNDPLEYKLETAEDGTKTATNPLLSVVVLPDGESRIFKRRAIKLRQGEPPAFKTVLIAELDGVRAYIRGGEIVLTRQDLKL